MALLFEMGSEYGQSDLFVEIAKRQLWVDDEYNMARPAWCTGSSCVLGVLNWLGVYVQSIIDRGPDNSAWKDRPQDPTQNIRKKAQSLGEQAIHADSEYKRYDGNAILQWGNRADVWEASQGRTNGPLDSQIYYRGGSGNFVMYSWNQYKNMGIDRK